MLVYVDTSVFGGAFDTEFEAASKAFFSQVREGKFEVAVSPLVVNELGRAPGAVTQLFEQLDPFVVRVRIDESAYVLRQAYLDAHVISAKWAADALHVAIARTIHECIVVCATMCYIV